MHHQAPIVNFSRPIPMCQSGTDLNSILHIFQHLSCSSLAIPLENGNWGVILAEDLLSLLTTTLLERRYAVVGYPKASERANNQRRSSQTINSIIKTPRVLGADSTVADFLKLEKEAIFAEKSVFLVVDALGKLEGQVDRDRLIEYLARSPQHQHQTVDNVDNSGSTWDWQNMLDTVTLPLKLESVAGEDLYCNQSWQKVFFSESATVAIDSCEANWWAKERDSSEWIFGFSQSESEDEVAPTLQRRNSPAKVKQRFIESQQASETVALQDICIEAKAGWNQIKLPLTTIHSERTNEPCWLIIATKIPLDILQHLSKAKPAQASEPIANLLAVASHELKSPLTGIVGLSSLLLKQKLGNLNQRQVRYVKLVQQSSAKMMEIVKNVLEVANLANNPLTEAETIDLELLCHQLYRQALLRSEGEDPNQPEIGFASLLKLNIESGTEIAIANKPILSAVLTHLILEILQRLGTENLLEIDVSRCQGQTAIDLSSSMRANSSILPTAKELTNDLGLNFVIAQYLTVMLQGSITMTHSTEKIQFSLKLPKDSSTASPLPSNCKPKQATSETSDNLTILYLEPEPNALNRQIQQDSAKFELKSWLDYQYRIVEADSLEQAHNLAQIWQLDAIVLDGCCLVEPTAYLRSLQESEHLAALPLITLDIRTTEAANQTEGLNVYPCLLPPHHLSLEGLMQVIEIATGK